MRNYARLDKNHKELCEIYRQNGCGIISLATLGKGIPDILVEFPRNGGLALVEIKSGNNGLTPDQEKFHAGWPGHIWIVRNISEVNAMLDFYKATP